MSRRLGESFVELPDAKQFLRVLTERVFQQPQDLSTVIRIGAPQPMSPEGKFAEQQRF
jgi:hypothetical protein